MTENKLVTALIMTLVLNALATFLIIHAYQTRLTLQGTSFQLKGFLPQKVKDDGAEVLVFVPLYTQLIAPQDAHK